MLNIRFKKGVVLLPVSWHTNNTAQSKSCFGKAISIEVNASLFPGFFSEVQQGVY